MARGWQAARTRCRPYFTAPYCELPELVWEEGGDNGLTDC